MNDQLTDEINVDIDTTEPDMGGYAALPSGKYRVGVTSANTKVTQSGDGLMWNITFDVLDAPYLGRKVFLNLYVKTTSTAEGKLKAVKISEGKLSALCRAAKKAGKLSSPYELVDLCLIADIGPDKEREGQNIIKDFYLLDGTKPKREAKAGSIAPVEAGAVTFDDDNIPF